MLTAAYGKLPPPIVPNPNMTALLNSYIDAMISAFSQTLKSVQITGSTVLGGAAPPGGPVVGALLTCPTPVFVPTSMSAVYNPPKFSVQMPDGSTRYGEYTAWLRTFTGVAASTIDAAIMDWLALWLAVALPVVTGGVTSWVPVPPAPGPWVGGTIFPFLFDGPAGGISASLQPAMAPTLAQTVGKQTPVAIKVTDSVYITTKLLTDGAHSPDVMAAVMAAFTFMFDQTKLVLMVKDPTGMGGTGVAAPGGVITGVMGPLVLDLV